ncbi:MAG: hypothetical protein ACOX8M_02045 [Marvinbryantia sp.]|jgi:hypothetical protein
MKNPPCADGVRYRKFLLKLVYHYMDDSTILKKRIVDRKSGESYNEKYESEEDIYGGG